jgi:hypothetical protein
MKETASIDYIEAHSFMNRWQMRLSVYAYEKQTIKSTARAGKPKSSEIITESWPAIDVLRKILVSNDDASAGTLMNIPVTIATKVRISRVDIQLPGRSNSAEKLTLIFSKKAPLVSCILEFRPDELQLTSGKVGSFVATSIYVELPVSNNGLWPTYIDEARITESKRESKKISPKDLIQKYFGLDLLKSGSKLILDSDGLIINGNRAYPDISGINHPPLNQSMTN